MIIKNVVREYSKQLKEVTHIPAKEVEILIMHLLQKNVIWLHLNSHVEFTKENELKELIKKRALNVPMEYLTLKASFYGEQFHVKKGVLIPRPETEILVEKAYEILKDIKEPKVLEIGTGSGIISVMLAKLLPEIKIIAIDINKKALDLAFLNAKEHKVEEKIEFIDSDLFDNVPDISFDMVVSNPPYIQNDYKLETNVMHEPSNALFGGIVGDELLKDIITQTNQKGIKYLLCEMGYDQLTSLKAHAKEIKGSQIDFYKDYENFDRGFTLEFKKQ